MTDGRGYNGGESGVGQSCQGKRHQCGKGVVQGETELEQVSQLRFFFGVK